MDEENELDSMQGISDEKMTELFNASIEIENEISRIKNVPIARYDVIQKKAYFEYPDGRIEYAKEAWNHSFCRAKWFRKNNSNKACKNHSPYINADDINNTLPNPNAIENKIQELNKIGENEWTKTFSFLYFF